MEWKATCYIQVTTLPSTTELGRVGIGPSNSGIGSPSIKKETGYRRKTWPWTGVRLRSRRHNYVLEKEQQPRPLPNKDHSAENHSATCGCWGCHPRDQLPAPSLLLFPYLRSRGHLRLCRPFIAIGLGKAETSVCSQAEQLCSAFWLPFYPTIQNTFTAMASCVFMASWQTGKGMWWVAPSLGSIKLVSRGSL